MHSVDPPSLLELIIGLYGQEPCHCINVRRPGWLLFWAFHMCEMSMCNTQQRSDSEGTGRCRSPQDQDKPRREKKDFSMDGQPTLRQAWPRERPRAAICVQDIDGQCVLQFTLIHAACCALHRLASRVIHCSEFFFQKFDPFGRGNKVTPGGPGRSPRGNYPHESNQQQ